MRGRCCRGTGTGGTTPPIRISRVEPLKTGRDLLRLSFFNACYASGVQDFNLDLRVLYRGYGYMMVKIEGTDDLDGGRCAVVTDVSLQWLECHFPEVIRNAEERPAYDPDSIARFLDQVAGSG